MARAASVLRRIATWRGLVVGVAVALLVVAVVLAWQGRSLREDSALDNQAQLDQANQERVIADVSRGLTQVLSYDYSQPDATRAFADQVLKGQAREEYDKLFEVLQERASGQKLTMAAQVQVAGVQELSAEKATLLVFVDQSSTRAKDDESSVSAAQLAITAERAGDSWVITGLEPL